MVLYHDKSRAPPREVEPLQHLDLVSLNIDRDKIERIGAACLFENAVESANRHVDGSFGSCPWRHAAPVERRQRSGNMQRQLLPGVRGGGAGGREYPGRAVSAPWRPARRARVD